MSALRATDTIRTLGSRLGLGYVAHMYVALLLVAPNVAEAQTAAGPQTRPAEPAANPAASAKPAAPEPDAAPGPATALSSGPATPNSNAEPAASSNAEPAASSNAEPAASSNAEPAAPAPTRRQSRWTPEEIARVRAELAKMRQRRHARPPRHGDARAHFTAGLEGLAIQRPDHGFERFDQGQLGARFGLFLGYDLLQLGDQLALVGELGAGIEHDESQQLLDAATTGTLSSQTLHLGLGLRWDVLPWLAPQLRAWGGASLFQLDITGTTVAYDTGHATSVFGALGAGFLLHTAPRTFENDEGQFAALQLGLLVEAGYALRSAIDFRLHTQPEPRRIEVIDASLGSLRLSGAYLRVAAVVRL